MFSTFNFVSVSQLQYVHLHFGENIEKSEFLVFVKCETHDQWAFWSTSLFPAVPCDSSEGRHPIKKYGFCKLIHAYHHKLSTTEKLKKKVKNKKPSKTKPTINYPEIIIINFWQTRSLSSSLFICIFMCV